MAVFIAIDHIPITAVMSIKGNAPHDLATNHPDRADDLFDFLQQVYDALKLAHPELPLFIPAG